MTRRRWTLLFVLVAVLVTAPLALGGAYWWRLTADGPADAATVVLIERGDSVARIAQRLDAAGVVEAPHLFRLAVRVRGAGRQLRAGEYEIPPRASLLGVVDTLVHADPIQRRLTVPEGLTSAAVVALVRAAPGLRGTVAQVPAEGALLPETYFYVAGDSRTGLVRRMQRAMDQALLDAWAQRAPGLDLAGPHEALTLASIVEKETAVAAERARVAAVFHNRLARRMRLQSDPTVIYAVAGPGGLDRPLSKADLETDHPYNTYTRRGLPPGPIANPGRAALLAAVRPADTDDLYFVADGSGGHAFARTLDAHNANVARWRRLQRNTAAADDADRDG
ncbi:UPF0755 protein [Rhodothalassium salexigens DSM 2132]|uniref:Endolytic murein transglycosylase n=1 Tax=Rhodothalassium salexigens DSM 2132 TaxID=1188247 RepID=A0A4V2SQG7_RHOSA|nr:endolytic transglycosylase MltG [Rhodothalassium salexigens]MBB4210272.1 UPF0755 protein [Rhodothalassium salexigens DSM 2132]MBK1638792.1 hypothetical protein [Rhodothalassium salexigens DSM 2132]TCP38436.1 UPF0755 protein [Rhodothalassium salexigens DSM 2132]